MPKIKYLHLASPEITESPNQRSRPRSPLKANHLLTLNSATTKSVKSTLTAVVNHQLSVLSVVIVLPHPRPRTRSFVRKVAEPLRDSIASATQIARPPLHCLVAEPSTTAAVTKACFAGDANLLRRQICHPVTRSSAPSSDLLRFPFDLSSHCWSIVSQDFFSLPCRSPIFVDPPSHRRSRLLLERSVLFSLSLELQAAVSEATSDHGGFDM
ncbi:hypothetical protein TIFTF001_031829 [Ficus carica]|uniref:Uncharacterized protein n=1 Tax=Ficus carica TaxID=3494 RepID=A0AA88E240_FICCA|nr:hypothetical protein TIFTF001_031829 [Ficus carica]